MTLSLFILAWFLDPTNNHQNIRNARMNLSYLNKNIYKCKIYKKKLELREVYKKTIKIKR